MSRRLALLPLALFALAQPAAAADAAREACGSKNPERVIAGCGEILDRGGRESFDGRARAHFNRGDALRLTGEHERAVADYTAALRLDPRFAAPAHNNRGLARKEGGDLDGAIADYSQSIRLDPRSASAHNNRGLARQDRGDLDRAIADFTQAIRLNGRSAAAYANRATAYKAKGLHDQAIADYTEALRFEPGNAGRFVRRGEIFALKGQPQRALTDYDVALLLEPGRRDATESREAAMRSLGRGLAPDAPAGAVASKFLPTGSDLPAFTPLSKLAARPPAPVPLPSAAAPSVGTQPAKVVAGVAAGSRVALVIGNGAYAAMPRLANPRNDAQDMDRALRELGFAVTLGLDLARGDMEDALIRFARAARDADTALVYYAGHGLQHAGVNYLAPIDAELQDETDLRKLVQLQAVVDDLQRAGRVRILMVDACRDNNVLQQLASRLPATRSAAFRGGLAPLERADGLLIAFATQANRVAADGEGRNSPFTRSLLKHLGTPGLELRTLLTRVRAEVVTATGGKQRPEVSDSLVGEFAFKAE